MKSRVRSGNSMATEGIRGGESMKDRLLGKLNDREACIGVVGLGYVGLPLALEFAKSVGATIWFDQPSLS